MRSLGLILAASLLLSACNSSPGSQLPQSDHQVMVVDRGADYSYLRLFSIEVAAGKAEQLHDLADCGLCGGPVPAPDHRTLYFVKSVVTGSRQENGHSFNLYDSKVVSLDLATGEQKEGPAFYQGPHAWFGTYRSISPDGRHLYLDIPHNPADARFNPIHELRGFVAYDLREQKLLERPFLALGADTGAPELNLSPDGKQAYLCCWVQGSDHPHPGITTVDIATGDVTGKVMINSSSEWVHPTRLTPAGDGRHFYAMRAGSNQWWEIDAKESKISRTGPVPKEPPSRPETARGGYISAAGSLVAAPGPGLLFSSLYLVEENRFEPGPPKYKEGGGILAFRTKDFKQAAHLLPDRTFEGLAISPDGSLLYALDVDARELLVFDTNSFKQVKSITDVGLRPTRILILRR